MKELHEIQIQILKKLLFSPSLRYTEIKPVKELENNIFDFHLKRMIADRYVIKQKNHYLLTAEGKEYANRIDTDKNKITKQAKTSVWVACTRKIGKDREFLIGTRLKHPFYGAQGLLSGKIDYGEKVLEAAKRELKEETNLTGNPELFGVIHFLVYEESTGKLLEDKFFYGCIVVDPIGELKYGDESKFEWVKEKDFKKYLTNTYESFDEFVGYLELVKNYKGTVTFIERVHLTTKF